MARPSRSSTQIRQSYNDCSSIGGKRDNGVPNPSSFPCSNFLRDAGILADFLLLCQRVGLTTYMEDESDQYVMLTKFFVESFTFSNSPFKPSIAFKIYNRSVTMTLVDFCAAIGIAPSGTVKKI